MDRDAYAAKLYNVCGIVSILCFLLMVFFLIMAALVTVSGRGGFQILGGNIITSFLLGLFFAALQDIGRRQMRMERNQRQLINEPAQSTQASFVGTIKD